MSRKPKGYWKYFINVKREVLAFLAEHGPPDTMPTTTKLRQAGHGSLVVAIHKYHGDFHQIARRLHLSMTRKPRGYWKDLNNVKREILAFTAKHGISGRMPTITELRLAGRGNLVSAIHDYHGDFHEVAQQLDLSTTHKAKGYWKDFANVKREVLAFIAEHGASDMMPTEGQLRHAGCSSLTFAICEYHGSFCEVARQLNLSTRRKARGSNHSGNQSKRDPTEWTM